MSVTQVITTVPTAGHRGIDARDLFVEKQEAFQDALTGVFVGELNTAIGQINATEANVNAKEASAEAHAATATAQAGIATTKASEASESAAAALISEANAEAAESNTTALLSQFQNNVYIRSATPPTSTEAAWFDTTTGTLKIWNSVEWVAAGTVVNGMYNRNTYTATAGQTVFNSVYDVDSVTVYRNGLMLLESDYTATNGTSITLATGATEGDVIDIIGFGAINAENIYSKAEVDAGFIATTGGTLTGNLTTKSITETVYSLTGTEISALNGAIQEKVLSGNTTLTETLTSGQSVTLHITIGANTLTFPTLTWVGGTPTIAKTGVSIFELWKTGTTLRGAYIGEA